MKSIDALSWSAKDSYCSEEYFQRMLILQRMKTHKTGQMVMLVLLDIGKLTKGKPAEKAFVLRRLMSALNSSTSDIDVKGWYLLDSILGVICQDVRGKHRAEVTGKIQNTLLEKGVFHLVGNTADAFKFLCLLYPDS
jgi:hypothetical protein